MLSQYVCTKLPGFCPLSWDGPMHTVKHLRDIQIATLAAQGMPLCRIAQHLHIHRNTVTQRLKRPETQQLVDALLAE